MPASSPCYDAVLLNGTVGAGKTTTAEALSDLEEAQGRLHAAIDLDAVRLLRPPPEDDPFAHEVELTNLRDLVRNYRAAGAGRFVVSGVVEEAAEVRRYREALGTERLLVVLLVSDLATVRDRLHRRHAGDPRGLAWHLDRTDHLARVLDRAAFADLRVDTTGRSPADVARRVREAAGWAR